MKDIEAATKWYEENRQIYELLARKVEDIIKENLEQNSIQHHSITSRAKSVNSYNEKAKNERYTNPIKEIYDMAGIRVITYLESDVSKVAGIIESIFDIDKDNSIDQSQLLGSDKLGYRSVHYVAKFNRKRCNLPEYKPYKNLPFEIQIRSILQHAWAEIEHDRNYKFSGKLPTKLERRFYLISGMLECADREFVSIARDIDEYKNTVAEELDKGELDIEINTTSLTEYLSNKFKKAISEGVLHSQFGSGSAVDKIIVEELKLFGISTLYELDRIIPKDYQDELLKLGASESSSGLDNFSSTIREILIINDFKKYFQLCWRSSWKYMLSEDIEKLRKFKVDTDYLKKYIKIDEI